MISLVCGTKRPVQRVDADDVVILSLDAWLPAQAHLGRAQASIGVRTACSRSTTGAVGKALETLVRLAMAIASLS